MLSEAELVSVTRIWDKAEYNSFTDLARFDGKWYCTFRESDAHELGRDGVIRVIVSADGRQWESAALLCQEGLDLRDPKISVTSDGRLMVRTDACLYRDGAQVTRDSRVSFSEDGRIFGPLQIQEFDISGEHRTDGHRLWRVSWHRDRAYGASALLNPSRIILCESADGLHWKGIARLAIPDEIRDGRPVPVNPSETTVRVLDDGVMLALVRQAWIGTSPPPYADWQWHKIVDARGHPPAPPHTCTIGGPNFIQLPDGGLWGSGRQYHRPDGKRTVLARMTRTHYEPVLTLPSGGDSSYAGMIWHEELLWMSYYSAHEGGPYIYLAMTRIKP